MLLKLTNKTPGTKNHRNKYRFLINLLIMIVKLSNFGSDFTNLPTLQTKFGVENLAVLLLKFPQLCINVEGAAKVCLPLFVTILGQVSEK